MSQRLQPVPRRHHKKSFSGCRSCKLRKVKCDETRPLCKNCAKHFINIDKCCFDPISPRGSSAKDATKVSATAELSQVQSSPGGNSKKGAGKSRAVHMQLAPPESMIIPSIVSSRCRHKCLPTWHEHTPVPMAISSSQMDPFNSHPATKAPDVDVLLSHYLSTFVLRNFLYFTTCPMVKLWWPFIQSDGLLFHVALLISSLSLEEAKGHREGNRSKHLLGGWNSRQLQAECIRQLRERVEDQVLGISDQTIVAVANLAAIEHERGNMKMVRMHMNGLKRMVSMRGGLNSIRDTSPLAANIAFWMSMVAMNEPQFLPAEFIGFEAPYEAANLYSFGRGLAENTPRLSIHDSDGSESTTQFGLFTPEATPQIFFDVNLHDYNTEPSQEFPQTVTPNDTYLNFCDPSDLSDLHGLNLTANTILATEFTSQLNHLPVLSTCSNSENTSTTSSGTAHVDFTTFGIPTPFAHLLHTTQLLSQRFAAIVDYSSGSDNSSSNNNNISVFGELCFLVQRLLRLPIADCISESCRFAAAIQLISPLWGYYPDCTLVVNALLHKLTASLKLLLVSSSGLGLIGSGAVVETAATATASGSGDAASPLPFFSSSSSSSSSPPSSFPSTTASGHHSNTATTIHSAPSPSTTTSAVLALEMATTDLNHLQLWLFAVGATEADRRMPEHDWFVDHLVVVVSELGVADWAQMRSVLVRFVWHDLFCEGPFRDVWEEVEARQEVFRGLEREVG